MHFYGACIEYGSAGFQMRRNFAYDAFDLIDRNAQENRLGCCSKLGQRNQLDVRLRMNVCCADAVLRSEQVAPQPPESAVADDSDVHSAPRERVERRMYVIAAAAAVISAEVAARVDRRSYVPDAEDRADSSPPFCAHGVHAHRLGAGLRVRRADR